MGYKKKKVQISKKSLLEMSPAIEAFDLKVDDLK